MPPTCTGAIASPQIQTARKIGTSIAIRKAVSTTATLATSSAFVITSMEQMNTLPVMAPTLTASAGTAGFPKSAW